ncbi:AFG1-like ATPase-domain-containing protein [Phlyctochytrium arcticum]|nr:AFG1-like ATPase-domain-containing protein [Phlyctochytrium arcticum]
MKGRKVLGKAAGTPLCRALYSSTARPSPTFARRSPCSKHSFPETLIQQQKRGVNAHISSSSFHSYLSIPACQLSPVHSTRHYATASTSTTPTTTGKGPAADYDLLVAQSKLNRDEHQIATVTLLQELFDRLQTYSEPPIREPDLDQDANLPSHKQKGRDDMESPDFAWIKQNDSSSGLFDKLSSWWSNSNAEDEAIIGPTGLYLFGDVGTGKTMVMDLFYNSINIPRKRRVHFHAFMQDVHRRIHKLRVKRGITYDPIPIIATDLANEAWLLCFDELQVTDITDAMILRRLFDELFKRGVVVVTTSNRPPDELYKNGIQRQSFLPCIALLKERCAVHSLNSGIDYRKLVSLRNSKSGYSNIKPFFSPLNDATRGAMDDIFAALTAGHTGNVFAQLAHGRLLTRSSTVGPVILNFLGRQFVIPQAADGVAKISFKEACGEPHSAVDYLEVVSKFHTILLEDIPAMTLDHRNEARRFITFIDTMYENKTRLILSADADVTRLFNGNGAGAAKGGPTSSEKEMVAAQRLLMDDLKLSPEQLTSPIFTGAEEIFAFQRAVSRLTEMQSHQWLGDDLKATLARRSSTSYGAHRVV